MMVIGSRKGWDNLVRRTRKPRGKPMQCYTERKDSVQAVGYDGYHAYLLGDEWHAIKKKVLEERSVCLLCERKADQVHHLSYDERTLLGQKPFHLAPLCSDCHRLIEYDGQQKLDLCHANGKLKRLAKKTGVGLTWLKKFKEEAKWWLDGKKAAGEQAPRCIKCRQKKPKKNRSICKACYNEGKRPRKAS